MADTPNRGYNRPDEGSLDWHTPLNENFTALDADVQTVIDHSPVYSTDFSETDRILVAETGDDIQPAIDAFANAGVTGVVQLLPGDYVPPGQIDLKGQVTLQGAAEVNIRGPMAATGILADNVADGNALVRWRPNDESLSASGSQVKDIAFGGKRKDGVRAAGLVCPSTVGNPRIVRCNIGEFYHNGLAFSGTQSGEVVKTRVTRCGVAANDTHGIDVGGGVEGGDFDRATIITTGFFGNGPTSNSAPVKVRNGSTLRFKPGGHRTGVRGHGPMNGPVVDVAGGDLEMDNAIITTNIMNPIGAGIRLTNGGGVQLHNVVVEKADPNILYDAGSLLLDDVTLKNAKLFDINGLGDGLWSADSGKAEEYELRGINAVGNKGDGLNVGRPGRKHFNINSHGNNGWGVNVDRMSNPPWRVVYYDRDPDKPNGNGDFSDLSKIAQGTDALA